MEVKALQAVRRRIGAAVLWTARRLLPREVFSYSMDDALRRIAAHAKVRTVVDVGASDGRWTIAARRHLSPAACLLVEAQAGPHEASLRSLKASDPTVDYVIAAAGDKKGTIHFDGSEPLGGQAADRPFAKNDLTVPMITIDALVAARGLEGPFLLKLDTHGFEVPILEGARITLQRTEAIVVEAYNFELSPTCLRFHELCSWLEERGFRCIDLCDVMHRPGDGALWQFDLVFVPAARAEFADTKWNRQ